MSQKQIISSVSSQQVPYPKFQSGLKKTLDGHINKKDLQWNTQLYANTQYKPPTLSIPNNVKNTSHNPISNPFFHSQLNPINQPIPNFRVFNPSQTSNHSSITNPIPYYPQSQDSEDPKKINEINEINDDIDIAKKIKKSKKEKLDTRASIPNSQKIESREEKLAKLRGRSFFRSSFKPSPTEMFGQLLTPNNAPEGFKPFQSPIQKQITNQNGVPQLTQQQQMAMFQQFMHMQSQYQQSIPFGMNGNQQFPYINQQFAHNSQKSNIQANSHNINDNTTSNQYSIPQSIYNHSISVKFNENDNKEIEKKVQEGSKNMRSVWNHFLNTKKSVLVRIDELSYYLFNIVDNLSFEATLQLLKNHPTYFHQVSSTEFECHSVREVERIEKEQNDLLNDSFEKKNLLLYIAKKLVVRYTSPSKSTQRKKIESIIHQEKKQMQELIKKIETIPNTTSIVSMMDYQKINEKSPIFRELKLFALGLLNDKNQDIYKKILTPLGIENSISNAFKLCREIGIFNTENIPLLKTMVLYEDNFKLSFDEHVIEEVKKIKDKFTEIPDPDEKQRTDFRDLVAFAIDDEHALEIDDAISVQQFQDKYHVYIHIADATKYIDPKGNVNNSALERVSSIYLPDTQIPMLPNELGVDVLSLSDGRENDVLTFSATLDSNGEILQCNVVPGKVSKVKRITYDGFDKLLKESQDSINLFLQVANLRLKHRLRCGAHNATLGAEEVSSYVYLDNETNDIHMKPKIASKRSRRIVEEFMIIANEVSAKFASQNNIVIPYRGMRGHKKETKQLTEDEITKIINSKQIDSTSDLIDRVKEYGMTGSDITHGAAAGMFSSPQPHHALGVSAYTFATSPLRRYVDLLVHHQIKNWIRGKKTLTWEEIEQHLSKIEPKQRQISNLQKDSSHFWTLKYFEKYRGETFPAIIYGIDSVISDSNSGDSEMSMLVDILLPNQGFHTKLQIQRDIRIGEQLQVQCVHASSMTSSLQFVAVAST